MIILLPELTPTLGTFSINELVCLFMKDIGLLCNLDINDKNTQCLYRIGEERKYNKIKYNTQLHKYP